MQITHLRALNIDHGRGDIKGVLGNRETERGKSSLFHPTVSRNIFLVADLLRILAGAQSFYGF